MRTVNLKLSNCLDCPYSKELPDPGMDSFDAMDTKIVCSKNRNKLISGAERPWWHRQYCKIPDWCPLSR